jgi:riboflavin kinase/FMN adenylyltransferase
MVINNGYENLNFKHPVVTVGVFDGVHLGHRSLLNHVISVASKKGGESVIVTFDPHPRLILSDNTENLFFLTTMDEKKKLLAEFAVDNLVIIDFTKDLSNLDAEIFIRDILIKGIGLKHLIVGYDNHFGKSRHGNFRRIIKYASEYGFTTEQAEKVSSPEAIISSTNIREALLKGNLENANHWLGYDYSLTGIVVEGRKIGRSFGYPTANIKPTDKHKLIPAVGVYAVEALVNGERLPGMLSIGFNPTITTANGQRSIEVNIFNFDMNIYDQPITVIFRFRLRDERRFGNIEQLAEQMSLDKQKALKLLGIA